MGAEFTGIYDGGYGAGSNPPASAIRGQISINKPGVICNKGLAYWVMVNQGNQPECTQNNTHSVYAQDGWLIDGYGNPQHFYERAEILFQPNCDPGPWIWAAATWSGSHTYEVQTGGANQGDWAEFIIDGVVANTLAIDWAHADNYQVAGEIAYSEEYMGGQTLRSLYHCEQGAQQTGCNPTTATNVGAVCPQSGNPQGCLGPNKNPNGCYYFNAGVTTSNGFNVYEKRAKSPPSC